MAALKQVNINGWVLYCLLCAPMSLLLIMLVKMVRYSYPIGAHRRYAQYWYLVLYSMAILCNSGRYRYAN